MKKDLSVLIAILSLFIWGFGFAHYEEYREINQLNIDGEWTRGIIMDKKYISGFGTSHNSYWSTKFQFSIDNNTCISFEKDLSSSYSIGDSVNVLYSKEYPVINKIVETCK